MVNLSYLAVQKPLVKGNRVELFNEVTVYLVCLLMSFLLDVKMPQPIIDMTGWAIIGVCSLNTFANFVLLLVGSLKQMITACKTRNYKRRATSALERKMIA